MSSDRVVAALALATAAFVSMPLAAGTQAARAQTPVRRRVDPRVPGGSTTVRRREPVEYVRICDAYGSDYFYIPGTDICLRVSGRVRYEVRNASDRNAAFVTSQTISAAEAASCAPFGSGFYGIPGTDTCLNVGGGVRTEITISGQDPALNGANGSLVDGAPNLFDLEIYGDASAGSFRGTTHRFLALEIGGQLNLGAVEYRPEGTSAGFEMGARIGISDRFFFGFSAFHSSFNDNQDLGDLNTAGAGLGIPGTGDPMSMFPAGIFLNPGTQNSVTNMHANFDWSATGAGFTVGTTLPLSSSFSVSPIVGFEFVRLAETLAFTSSIPGFMTDAGYDSEIDAFRKSLAFGARLSYAPADWMLLYYLEPMLFFDCLEYSGTDRFNLSGFLNDAQAVDFDGGYSSLGFALAGGVTVPIDSVKLNLGFGYERRVADVAVFRSGQLNEQSQGDPGYVDSFNIRLGVSYTMSPGASSLAE